MSEDQEPDWRAELAKGGEALRRQVEQVIRDARRAKSRGRALPLSQRVALAFDAAIRELVPPDEPIVPNVAVTAGLATASGVAVTPATVTGGVSFGLPRITVVASGDMASTSEGFAVKAQGPHRSLAGVAYGQVLFLVLLWLLVLVIPAAAWDANLPPEVQALVDVYDGVLANVAVVITFDILSKRKKR